MIIRIALAFVCINLLLASSIAWAQEVPAEAGAAGQEEPEPAAELPEDDERPARFEDELTVVGQEVHPVEPMQEVAPELVVIMPGAGEDVLQTIAALPGVLSVDDWSARLYVRGGRPDQNGIYIDGISVYDPYRLFGLTSLFNPETVDSISFYPGGFDVLYGDHLSAVIAVENRDGTTDRPFSGSANISLTNANLVAEGALSESVPSSWLVSARRTYYDVALELSGETDSQFPSFTDFQARLLYQPAPGHRFNFTLLGYDESTDLLEDEDPDFGDVDDHIDAVDDQKGFIAGLHGEHLFATKLRLNWVLSASNNQQTSDVLFREGETGFESTIDQNLEGDVLSLRTLLEYSLDGHTIQGGFEASQSDNTVNFHFRTEDPRIPIPDTLLDFDESQDFQKYAAFVQDIWQLSPKLAFKAGVRWDRSTLSEGQTTSPRLSMRYNPTPRWELRGAWGEYSQFASYESLQGDGYFLDLRGIKELALQPERAQHFLLSMSHSSSRGWKLGLDLYHKELEDLFQSGEFIEEILVLDDNDVAQPYLRDQPDFIPENGRSGYARGAELSFTILERSDRPYYGMLSYSYGQAESEDLDGWLWEDWDRRHSVDLIGGWRIGEHWEIGWRWRYATGFPFTPLTNVIRVVEDLDGDGIYDPDQGDWFTYQRDEPFEVENSERLPAYHRLDLRVQYQRRFSKLDTTFYFDLINAYARENVLGYDYNQDYTQVETAEGMPLLPSIGVKVAF